MASTRLVRKALRNRAVSKKRVNNIKRLTSRPVIKNVDIEQIKEEFANKPSKPAVKKEEAPVKEAAPKVETKKVENKVETAAPEAKEEKKSTAKKAPAKKAAPKAKKEAAPKAKKKEDKAE